MHLSLGMIIGAGEVIVGAFVPGSGLAADGALRIARSVIVKPVVNEVMAPVVEKVGNALDLEGSTLGELAKDLYVNKTDYAELADAFPF